MSAVSRQRKRRTRPVTVSSAVKLDARTLDEYHAEQKPAKRNRTIAKTRLALGDDASTMPIPTLPPEVEVLKQLRDTGERLRSHTHTMQYVVFERGMDIPDLFVVTKQQIDRFLVQPRQMIDRPCVAGSACVAVRHYGFQIREFPPPNEEAAFERVRQLSGGDAGEAIRQLQYHYPCVLCELEDWQREHLERSNRQNYRDPRQMVDQANNTGPPEYNLINRWHVVFDKPGQYRLDQCLGLADPNYTGLWGAIPAFSPGNFIPRQRVVKGKIQKFLHQVDEMLFGAGAAHGVSTGGTSSLRSIHTGSR